VGYGRVPRGNHSKRGLRFSEGEKEDKDLDFFTKETGSMDRGGESKFAGQGKKSRKTVMAGREN